jgi:hypothetical protein
MEAVREKRLPPPLEAAAAGRLNEGLCSSSSWPAQAKAGP